MKSCTKTNAHLWRRCTAIYAPFFQIMRLWRRARGYPNPCTCCHVMVLLILSNYRVRHKSTDYHQGVVAEWSKALFHRSWRRVAWVRIPLETYIFIFEFFNFSLFRTAQWIPWKWNQVWPFTCSHSCFRPQIQLIIQGLVYIYSRSIALMSSWLLNGRWMDWSFRFVYT